MRLRLKRCGDRSAVYVVCRAARALGQPVGACWSAPRREQDLAYLDAVWKGEV